MKPLLLLLLASAAAAEDPIAAALEKAGRNRAQLEEVLAHFAGDPQKRAAAEFLIANMDGHGHIRFGLFDKEGHEVAFDALAYPDFASAQAALDALEKEHGTLEFRRREFVADLETITAEFLIADIEESFAAWRGHPWSRPVSFELFCECILPYRGSEEPLGPWREACAERLRPAVEALGEETDIVAAGNRIGAEAGTWARFNEIYYLHPTDQGFDEIMASRLGRCEDLANLKIFAMRSCATLCASDYTPAWADRDNNHAWEVVLDAQGRGRAGLSNRAAKVYRKTFRAQRESLGALRRSDEEVPRWLSGTHYADVTDQYVPSSDVPVAVGAAPEGQRFAYLWVFNGGEWVAIHWAPAADGRALFTKMGRDIAYLPAWQVKGALRAAGPPFLLRADGTLQALGGREGVSESFSLAATRPASADADTRSVRPREPLVAGTAYELFFWDGEWRSLGQVVAGDSPVAFREVPPGRLYWLRQVGSRGLERIFTIDEGRQVWW